MELAGAASRLVALAGYLYRHPGHHADGAAAQGADVERGATFICIGALLHIAEDAFCGKVPLFLPWQKVGIKLFTVGSVTEYLFSMAVVILTYIIHAQVMVK